MKGVIISFFLMMLMFISCSKKVNVELEKAKVQSVLDQLEEAINTKNLELLSKIHSHDKDFIFIGLDTSEQFIGWVELEKANREVLEKIEDRQCTFKNQNICVSELGNVAWFSRIADIKIVKDGKQYNFESIRSTGILEKRNGNWIFVQFHSSFPVSV
jgi:ketosteroid isomerase-like protein